MMQKLKKITFFWVVKLLFRIFIASIVASVLCVALYKVIDPPFTPLMLIRIIEGAFGGRAVGIDYQWRDYQDISPNIFRAVMSGEDGKFLKHNGFDWDAIKRARRINTLRKGKRMIGASTISMQTSKNAFLWQGRNYVRKALEAYFTVLIEAVWGKQRILEVYVNIIEWGDGIYGVQAAARKYFNKDARDLTKKEAALLASVLPNPRKWSPAQPTAYIQKRSGFIQARMNGIALPKND
jgi:monofunctional biosynthetic peptidoglycan transglycosylase